MPAEGLGLRHDCLATKQCKHGQIVTEQGFVGAAFDQEQMSRYVDPTSAAATNIEIGDDMTIQLGGTHEAPCTGNLAAVAVGNDVYIQASSNTLGLAAQALTTGNLNAGWLPVGKVTSIDLVRNPDVAIINANMAHLVKVGTGG